MRELNDRSRRPEEFTEYEESVMSNSDHQIEVEVAEYIKDKPLHSHYAGWNFSAQVWYENNKWCCEVWTYRSFCETFIADTLEEIMSDVSSQYGYD